MTFDSWVRRRRWKEALKRIVFRRVDGIMTGGEDGRVFAGRSGAAPERIHVVRHVVDVDFFASGADVARPGRESSRAELGLNGVVFIYVGRMWSGKGTDSLLTAYQSVERELPNDVSLLLVGDGPEEARIARTALSAGLNVKLAGFHHRADLPRLYAASDVFVFPTLGDPYGLVVDEAMAASLPIICTTAAGEIRERVVDGVNGYLVPPNDPPALAAAMLRLAGDAVLRSQMGTRSYQMIRPFSPDSWAEAFERAVDEILLSRRAGAPR